MENETKTNDLEAISRRNDDALREFAKEVKKLRTELDDIHKKEREPIDVRVTRLEARMLNLEELLTEETPTGRIKVTKVGRVLRDRRAQRRG